LRKRAAEAQRSASFSKPMSYDLLPRISFVDYEEYGSLFVKAVECHDGNLLIYLDVKVDEDAEHPRSIRLTCKSYVESNLSPGSYLTLEIVQDHVLLWHYNQPHVLTTFHGKVSEPLSVVGALFERHVDLAEGWIPFTKYLNTNLDLSALIGGSFGMIADGPEQLIMAYEEVLRSYEVSVSHHKSSAAQDESLSLLMLDQSYVIAKSFWAEAI
jgi:hypothetical protein